MPQITTYELDYINLGAICSTALALLLCPNAVKASSSYIVLGSLIVLSVLKAGLWHTDKPFAKGSDAEVLGYIIHSIITFALLVLASKYLRSFTEAHNTVEKVAAISKLPNLLSGWYVYAVPALFLAISAWKHWEEGPRIGALYAGMSFCPFPPVNASVSK